MTTKRKVSTADYQLLRLPCGSGYTTADERFWVARGPQGKGWEIGDATKQFSFSDLARTLADAEQSIANALRGKAIQK